MLVETFVGKLNVGGSPVGLMTLEPPKLSGGCPLADGVHRNLLPVGSAPSIFRPFMHMTLPLLSRRTSAGIVVTPNFCLSAAPRAPLASSCSMAAQWGHGIRAKYCLGSSTDRHSDFRIRVKSVDCVLANATSTGVNCTHGWHQSALKYTPNTDPFLGCKTSWVGTARSKSLFRIPHHAPGRLFEDVSCPSASGRDLMRVKNQNLQLRNSGVQ